MENLVNIKINGFDYQVPAGSTLLEAAHSAGIEIPTLCYLKDINAIGACRICVVEVKGARSLVASCVFPVNDGMEIFVEGNEDRIMLMARYDNLGKGASGAAIQNMNILLGVDETTGLNFEV